MKRLTALLLGMYLAGSAVGCCCCHRNRCAPPCPPPASPCNPCNTYPNVYGPAPTDAPVFPQTGGVQPGAMPVAYGDPILINSGVQTVQGDVIAPF